MLISSKLALGLSLLVAAVIAFLTLTPTQAPDLQSFRHSDKIYHAIAFAALAFPMALFRPGWLIVAAPVYAAFGGLIEIVQPLAGRECSLADWIADLIGIGLGIGGGISGAVVLRTARSVSMRSKDSRSVHSFRLKASGCQLDPDASLKASEEST